MISKYLSAIAKDRGMQKSEVIEVFILAIYKSIKMTYGNEIEVDVCYSFDKDEFQINQILNVVQYVKNRNTEISLDIAKKQYSPLVQIGDCIAFEKELNFDRFITGEINDFIKEELNFREMSAIMEEFKAEGKSVIRSLIRS